MNRSGFSLIELLVAIALIAAVAALVVPNISFRIPKQEREQFVASLNNLLTLAWHHAVASGKVCKVAFNFSQEVRMISLEEQTQKKDESGNQLFAPLEKKYQQTTLKIPDFFVVKNFFIEGTDEVTRYSRGQQVEAWFFISPEGIAQAVIINGVDTQGKKNVGLVLNQFSARFDVYDAFQKPNK